MVLVKVGIMIRVEWMPISKKINTHFKYNVFKPTLGPDFKLWLQEETGGKLIYSISSPSMVVEFANDEDYTMFMLKWS
jgi:hypothetical protein